MQAVTEVIRYKIIRFSEKQAVYSFERLPIDIYNLRTEYQSSVPYRIIPEVEEEEDDNKIVILGIEQYSIFSYY